MSIKELLSTEVIEDEREGWPTIVRKTYSGNQGGGLQEWWVEEDGQVHTFSFSDHACAEGGRPPHPIDIGLVPDDVKKLLEI